MAPKNKVGDPYTWHQNPGTNAWTRDYSNPYKAATKPQHKPDTAPPQASAGTRVGKEVAGSRAPVSSARPPEKSKAPTSSARPPVKSKPNPSAMTSAPTMSAPSVGTAPKVSSPYSAKPQGRKPSKPSTPTSSGKKPFEQYSSGKPTSIPSNKLAKPSKTTAPQPKVTPNRGPGAGGNASTPKPNSKGYLKTFSDYMDSEVRPKIKEALGLNRKKTQGSGLSRKQGRK